MNLSKFDALCITRNDSLGKRLLPSLVYCPRLCVCRAVPFYLYCIFLSRRTKYNYIYTLFYFLFIEHGRQKRKDFAKMKTMSPDYVIGILVL